MISEPVARPAEPWPAAGGLGLHRLVLWSIAAIHLLLLGCSDVDTARWTEDVNSWDGRISQLEGYAERGKSGWPLEHRGGIRFIEHYQPESGAYWQQRFGYHPVVFDFVDGRPITVVQANSDGGCYLHGYPKFGLLAFAWTGSG